MADAEKTFAASEKNPLAVAIMDFIDQVGNDADIPLYTIIKNY